jgi:hypothetical protein
MRKPRAVQRTNDRITNIRGEAAAYCCGAVSIDMLCFLVGEANFTQNNFVWILCREFDLNRLARVCGLYAQLLWYYLSCVSSILHIALNLAIVPGQSDECAVATWIKERGAVFAFFLIR